MFSVIFEVLPNEGRKDEYLELAKHLKPILEKIDGFVDNERFESQLKPGWVLSHSTWRDEKSVVRWRTEGEHHKVQATFTEITPKKGAAFAAQPHLLPAHLGLDLTDGAVAEHDVYASIYNPGKLALLTSWKDTGAGKAWSPEKIDGIEMLRHRRIRVVRDYGRFDRREAPQFYRDVKGSRTKHPAPAH
jgi:heme-degrading monooxygenase HmoA